MVYRGIMRRRKLLSLHFALLGKTGASLSSPPCTAGYALHDGARSLVTKRPERADFRRTWVEKPSREWWGAPPAGAFWKILLAVPVKR